MNLKIIFRDIRCLLNSFTRILLAFCFYVIGALCSYWKDNLAYILLILAAHLALGAFAIFRTDRLRGFSFLNLVGEISFMSSLGWTMVLIFGIILGSVPNVIHRVNMMAVSGLTSGYYMTSAFLMFLTFGVPNYLIFSIVWLKLSIAFPDEARLE